MILRVVVLAAALGLVLASITTNGEALRRGLPPLRPKHLFNHAAVKHHHIPRASGAPPAVATVLPATGSNFEHSCTNIAVSTTAGVSTLTAQCDDGTGTHMSSSLDLSTCYTFNHNTLACTPGSTTPLAPRCSICTNTLQTGTYYSRLECVCYLMNNVNQGNLAADMGACIGNRGGVLYCGP
ncbi:uncharacterized protein LOC62_02G001840 [Vanrija pseudolonga]|uniref:Cyanovirin-N domain-containing protein n=1 Tax=Vanrija pseudolonga TaxID=143232 RepID=A0AAF0Y1D3_9TREE|nr:hypothetical protein LOC62_02G001840 [Vanrija pseudolonga]